MHDFYRLNCKHTFQNTIQIIQ